MHPDRIRSLAREAAPQAVRCRRHLHQHPELSFAEKETSEYVAAQLKEMGVAFQTGVGGYGIKAVLQGGKGPGKCIALRADMDALPILEETGLPFASTRPGLMHACGHDVHTATLLGAAGALPALLADLSGQVVLIFQPGEETNPGGASLMIRDGVLEGPRIDAIFGLHVFPSLTAGEMTFGDGPKLASPDELDITVRGKGGHGAYPHATIDAVYVACQIVGALQSVVSRSVSPFDPVVVTIGAIHSGSKHNIIPGEARLQGTIRTMREPVREAVHRRVREVAEQVAAAHGAVAEVSIERGYPVLVNAAAETALARRAAEAVLGEARVSEMGASMGGEDFAFFLQERPGSFARLGSSRPDDSVRAGLHTPYLMIDEGCIETGIAYYLSLVQDYLG